MSNDDIKALLDIAKQPIVKEKTTRVSDAEMFCRSIRLLPGDVPIPASLIYEEYKRWKGVKRKLETETKFFRDLKKILPKKQLTDVYCYLVNDEGLSNGFIQEAQEFIDEKKKQAKARKRSCVVEKKETP